MALQCGERSTRKDAEMVRDEINKQVAAVKVKPKRIWDELEKLKGDSVQAVIWYKCFSVS